MLFAKYEINCPVKLQFGMRNTYTIYTEGGYVICNVERVVRSRYRYIVTITNFDKDFDSSIITDDNLVINVVINKLLSKRDRNRKFTVTTLLFDTDYKAKNLTYEELKNRLKYAYDKYGDVEVKMNTDGILTIKPVNVRCVSALKFGDNIVQGIVPCAVNEIYCSHISDILSQLNELNIDSCDVILSKRTGGTTTSCGVVFIDGCIVLMNNFSGRVPVVWNDLELF